jgi:hypothetical protein
VAEKREAVLSNYVPSRPTDILRRGLLSLFPDSMDQVSRQNAVDTLEKIANLSILPALGDLGYSATETAAKPSAKGAIDTLLQAALILPGVKGLHVPKSPAMAKTMDALDVAFEKLKNPPIADDDWINKEVLAQINKSKFKDPVKLDAPTPVTNKTKMIDPLKQVPWEAEPGVFAYDNTGGESYLVDPFKTKTKDTATLQLEKNQQILKELKKLDEPQKLWKSDDELDDALIMDFNADPYSPMNTEPDWKPDSEAVNNDKILKNLKMLGLTGKLDKTPTGQNVDDFVTEQLVNQTKPPKSSSTVTIGTPEWDELDKVLNAKIKKPPAQHSTPASNFKAWHSSPHDFSSFSNDKIGTGEGTIMEGSGMYLSDDPIVRDFYRRQFSKNGYPGHYDDKFKISQDEYDAFGETNHGKLTPKEALEELKLKEYWGPEGKKKKAKLASILEQWDISGVPTKVNQPAKTYEVNVNTDPSRLPQMDRPIGETGDSTFNALMEAYFKSNEGVNSHWYPKKSTNFLDLQNSMLNNQLTKKNRPSTTLEGMDPFQGQLDKMFSFHGDEALEKTKELVKKHGGVQEAFDAYEGDPSALLEDEIWLTLLDNIENQQNATMGAVHNTDNWKAAKEVSDLLLEQGIKGHKYLPSEGKYGDNNTRNYVIYDDKIIDIIKKYGLAGLVSSGLLGSLMSGTDQPVQNQ